MSESNTTGLDQPRVMRLSPVVPTNDIEATQSFLVELFGFQVRVRLPRYRVLTLDGYDLHLTTPIGDKAGQLAIYIEVDDVNLVWESCSALTDDPGEPPSRRDHGMVEFHLILPHTRAQLSVGQRAG